MTPPYDPETEDYMRLFFSNLREKDRRHYAAIEALKLGLNGIPYISNLFDISPRTVVRGIDDIKKKDL
jgi:hypothetical protein